MIWNFFNKVSKIKRNKIKLRLQDTYLDSKGEKDFDFFTGDGKLIRRISILKIKILFSIIIILYFVIILNVYRLQIVEGSSYRKLSENNTFDKVIVFPTRGVIYDRDNEELAWNKTEENNEITRKYTGEGFSSLLGFIRYPKKDRYGNYYRTETEGVSGIEGTYNYILAGGSGSFVREGNATGEIISELYIEEQIDGKDVTLTIDKGIQKTLYDVIKTGIDESDFKGGAGVIMNIENGDLLSAVSYPDFNNNKFTDRNEVKNLEKYIKSHSKGELTNRSLDGLYTPGSTVKPFFGLAALEEEIIDPRTVIHTKGKISVQNPYDEESVFVYRDYKNLGSLDIYSAIAKSSNIYFYHIGGGYGNIDGLGIDRIILYADIFGLGQKTNLGISDEPYGLIPSPKWKEEKFKETWRVGDTYNTVIGQYSFQVTPLQLVRAIASIANNGFLVEPNIILNDEREVEKKRLAVSQSNLGIIREAMRKVVTEGTAKKLNSKDYNIAAKSGTSQIGIDSLENSLLIGFFPHKKPKYAFVFVAERGTESGTITNIAKNFFDRISLYYPDEINLK